MTEYVWQFRNWAISFWSRDIFVVAKSVSKYGTPLIFIELRAHFMLKKSNFNVLWNQFDSIMFHSMIEMGTLAEIVWRSRVSDQIFHRSFFFSNFNSFPVVSIIYYFIHQKVTICLVCVSIVLVYALNAIPWSKSVFLRFKN